MKKEKLIIGGGIVGAILVVSLVVWLFGSNNPYTPAGYVGYLEKSSVFGSARFYGLQDGPGSPGKTWLLSVTNVSITPYTYHEDFSGENQVLSKDNLNIGFSVHVTWNVKKQMVREFMEGYTTKDQGSESETLVKNAYENYIRQPLRTLARNEVQKRDGLKIKDELIVMGDAVMAAMQEKVKNTPFHISEVVIGNVQYPEVVKNSVSEKLAASQRLEKENIEIDIERKKAEKRAVEAEGIAKSMEIIQAKLTAAYLQHEAIEAQKSMANSPNHTTVYIPVGNNGIPLIGDITGGKTTQPTAGNSKRP